MCTVSPHSGTVCSFECRHGFSGNGGVNKILCGNDGNWTKNESSILQCLGTRFVIYHILIGICVVSPELLTGLDIRQHQCLSCVSFVAEYERRLVSVFRLVVKITLFLYFVSATIKFGGKSDRSPYAQMLIVWDVLSMNLFTITNN